MQTVAAFDAKTHFSALLVKVENGAQVIITKHGHPVAKIIPFKSSSRESIKNTITAIKEFSKHHNLGKLNWKDLRDEGRRY